MSEDSSRLSPRAAMVIGLALVALGAILVLRALGALGPSGLGDTPRWIGVLAGLVFTLGGGAVIVGYAIAGGAGPDGDLPPGTPRLVRAIQYVFGLGIVAALALIGSWVAFGPGPRHFTGIGLLGYGAVDELVGRAAFGIGSALAWVFLAVLAVVGLRRLRRPP